MSPLPFELLLAEPRVTPQAWLASQPHWEFALGATTVVFTQPSSSLIVFAFGLLTMVLGGLSLANRPAGTGHGSFARHAWGWALLLWGAGALAAGVSYQAFGYALKAEGREWVAFTDWWEIAYLALSATSIAVFGLAVAWNSLAGRARTALIVWSGLSLGAYSQVLGSGLLSGDRFGVSFEAMVLITTPSFLLYFAVAVVRWRKTRSATEARLARVWLGLGVAFALYGLAAALGLGSALWRQGIWFTENDVLHLALAVWMLDVYRTGGELR